MINIRAARRKEKTTRNKVVILRATKEEKEKLQAVTELMQMPSASEVFRTLLTEKAHELGVE